MRLFCVPPVLPFLLVIQATMIKVHMKAAARKTRSFNALQNQAPVTLEGFMTGFRSAMFHIPVAEERSE